MNRPSSCTIWPTTSGKSWSGPNVRGARHHARGPQNLDELSQSAIQHALQSCRGNVSHAARVLGISRQTLYRKLALRKERHGQASGIPE